MEEISQLDFLTILNAFSDASDCGILVLVKGWKRWIKKNRVGFRPHLTSAQICCIHGEPRILR